MALVVVTFKEFHQSLIVTILNDKSLAIEDAENLAPYPVFAIQLQFSLRCVTW